MQHTLLGPRGIEIVKVLWGLRANYAEEYHRLFQKYGDVVFIPVANRYVFFHPDDVQYILRDHPDKFCKGVDYEVLKHILGNGLLTSEGEHWRTARRVLGGEFSIRNVAAFAPTITTLTNQLLQTWQRSARLGEPRNVADDMMELTLKIAGQTLFGAILNEDVDTVRASLTRGAQAAVAIMASPIRLPLWVPLPSHSKLRKAVHQIDAVVYRMIERKLHDREIQQNVLSKLIKALQQEDPHAIDHRRLRDECTTILLAGHETTSNALTWTLYLLSQHRDVLNRLQEEIAQVLGGRHPDYADVEHLKYTRMVLQESMRLYPPVPGITRQSNEALEIGARTIPKDAIVEAIAYVTHRHPDFWTEPNRFDPERFHSDRVKLLYPGSYFPFGLGPRRCIGEHMAMLEMSLVLPMLVQAFELRLVEGFKVVLHSQLTMRAQFGLVMELRARRA